MIGTVEPEVGKVDARSLSAVFSNVTRCEQCRGVGDIRIHYDPGCVEIRGAHFHRFCPCGHAWAERPAGHGGFVDLDNPAFVLVCQRCRGRVPTGLATAPRCCARPEVSYHDVRTPCELCSGEREPGMEG